MIDNDELRYYFLSYTMHEICQFIILIALYNHIKQILIPVKIYFVMI